MPIENVSDTARWVAVYRAMETSRPDAIFRDPFAERLAGERGVQIVEELKYGRRMAWAMIVRTAVFDEIILDRIRRGGIDTVLNLAAGLDTRAWRMDLPSTLRWFDVDLPAMSEYKATIMRSEKPVCQYEAIPADLTNADVRHELFRRVGGSSTRLLVVTEGLLLYLDDRDVQSLARAIHAMPSAQWWLSDIASPMLLQFMSRSWGKAAEKGNAPFKFAPPDRHAFFSALGWKEIDFRSMMAESRRLNRQMKSNLFIKLMTLLMPAKRRAEIENMSGVTLMERV